MASPRPVRHAADLELARGAALRQPESLEELGRRMECIPGLLGAGNRRAAIPIPANDLQDLAQDVAVYVLRAMPGYRGEARLEVLFWRTCRNRLLNHRRSCARAPRLRELTEQGLPAEESASPESAGSDPLDGADLAPEVADLIRRRVYEGESFVAISHSLRKKESTIKSRFYAGLRALRRRWPELSPSSGPSRPPP